MMPIFARLLMILCPTRATETRRMTSGKEKGQSSSTGPRESVRRNIPWEECQEEPEPDIHQQPEIQVPEPIPKPDHPTQHEPRRQREEEPLITQPEEKQPNKEQEGKRKRQPTEQERPKKRTKKTARRHRQKQTLTKTTPTVEEATTTDDAPTVTAATTTVETPTTTTPSVDSSPTTTT